MTPRAVFTLPIVDRPPREVAGQLFNETPSDQRREPFAKARVSQGTPERRIFATVEGVPEKTIGIELLWVFKHCRVLVAFAHAQADKPAFRNHEVCMLDLSRGDAVQLLALFEAKRFHDDPCRERRGVHVCRRRRLAHSIGPRGMLGHHSPQPHEQA